MTMQSRHTVRILDPVGEVKIGRDKLSPRVNDVRGKRIGYLFNGHPAWKQLWDILHDDFAGQYEPSGEVRREKRNLSAPATGAVIEEMATGVQAAIVGVGA